VTAVALEVKVTTAPAGLSVSVVICTYNERRWEWLAAAVAAVRAQSRSCDDLLLVVDHNQALLQRARAAFAGARVLANEERPGLAGARNTGVSRSSGDVIVFLDDDAVAESDCLERLIGVYSDPQVIGAGGAAIAAWPDKQPRWFPEEFNWVMGCAYRGLPVTTAQVRNPIGACMSFRRTAFDRAGGFTYGIGRTAADRMGCEETEFSIRVRRTVPGSVLLYVPTARVRHHVDDGQQRWRHFLQRCLAEGHSKALVAREVGSRDALASEWPYALRVLTAGAARGVRDALRGRPSGLLRTGAIGAGLATTTYGYLTSRVRLDRERKCGLRRR
jgi:glycosyltransferase involved in cell wall biosynthesis